MGMIANYQAVSDMEFEQGFDLDDVESLQEKEDAEICDIDKMWDALHFLLTGKSAAEPLENNLISEAIVGQFPASGEDAGEIYSRNTQRQGKRNCRSIAGYIEQFNMNKFAENEIYPDIWEYEEEADEIKDDLRLSFESLKKFYEKMSKQGSAVLVSIY